jgi:excinuclease ABC subunit C
MTASPQTASDFDFESFLKNLTTRPGVYRMLDSLGNVLYVGKARNLKNRVSSYFRRAESNPKTRALLAQTHALEVTVTHTEGEALLLESNLIKKFRPRYNVLLRDDKSYPFIHLSAHLDFPRLTFYRGSKQPKGRYFGPYPSVGAVRETLNLLQKVFRVRQCEDSYFSNRSRPCLQYQIKRCTAPCVGWVDPQTYQEDIRHAVMFLEGKSQQLIDELVAHMESASRALAFEEAAHYRDQIVNLRKVQEHQHVSSERGDLDVIAATVRGNTSCVYVLTIRTGRILGTKTFYPRTPPLSTATEVLEAFVSQYYLSTTERGIPEAILVNEPLPEQVWLAEVLSARGQHKVSVLQRVRGERAHWLEMAVSNAQHALDNHLSSRAGIRHQLEALQEVLGLDELPQRLECFDISHTQGEAPVASCVVFDTQGMVKSDYRRFNIENIVPGDDYAAMHQALTRRYTRLKEEDGKFPDVLLIDGGKGQLTQAQAVMEAVQIAGITLVAVAKGPSRKPGLEQLFLSGRSQLSGSGQPIILGHDSSALHLIQQIRDEAHRFAITGHRSRRSKTRITSALESIPGVGAKRRQRLLQQFGGLQWVKRAGVEDLEKVPGISQELAERIYAALHDNSE